MPKSKEVVPIRGRKSGPRFDAATAMQMSDRLSQRLSEWAASQPDNPDREAAMLRLLKIGIGSPARRRPTRD